MLKIIRAKGLYTSRDSSYTRHIITFKAARGLSQKGLIDAVYNRFLRFCYCAHDCCGCISGGADLETITRNKGREYRVLVNYSQNI